MKKHCFHILASLLIIFTCLFLMPPSAYVSAYTTSHEVKIGTSKVITDNQYSEGFKEWSISDPTVGTLTYSSPTQRVFHALKLGSTTIVVTTTYTTLITDWDSTLQKPVSVPKTTKAYAYINITVVEKDVVVTPPLTLTDKSEYTLTPTSKIYIATSAERESLTWASSNSAIADVDATGVVLAKKTGSVTVTATDSLKNKVSVTIKVATPSSLGYTPISSISDLKKLANSKGSFYLTKDLDFASSSYASSGWRVDNFSGILDGAGYTIKHLKGSNPLLYTTNNALIRNLTLSDCSIDGQGGETAAIIAIGSVSMNNCHVLRGSVKNATSAGGLATKKLLDGFYNNFYFCTNSASVTGMEISGGIAGSTWGYLLFCKNRGNVAISSPNTVSYGYVGGIVGCGYYDGSNYSPYQMIEYCFNSGKINGIYTGGIGGYLKGVIIKKCANSGIIGEVPEQSSGGSYSCLGGIVGNRELYYYGIKSTITDCYNYGTIYGDDTRRVCRFGGIIGVVSMQEYFVAPNITNCYNVGTITYANTFHKRDSSYGGIVARIFIGGFCGVSVSNSYSMNAPVIGHVFISSTQRGYNQYENIAMYSETQMKSQSIYNQFNFKYLWKMTPSSSYPYPRLAAESFSYYGLNAIKPTPKPPGVTKYTVKIKYVLNSGKNSSKNKSVYVTTSKIKLYNPTRKSYTFEGWYTDKHYKKKVTSISPSNKSHTLYAKWKKVTTPGKVTISKLSIPKSKQLKVTYNKVSGVKGYAITYATNKSLTKSKKTVYTTKTSYTLSKLAKGKTYYVSVKAYRIDSTGKKIYGQCKTIKSIKIK